MEWQKEGEVYKCKCKAGYPEAGEGCVKQADLDAFK